MALWGPQSLRWGGIPVHWGFLCRIEETKLRGAWSWGLNGLDEDPSRKGQYLGALARPFLAGPVASGWPSPRQTQVQTAGKGGSLECPASHALGGRLTPRSLPLGLLKHHQVSSCRPAVGCPLSFISQNAVIQRGGFAGVHLGLAAFGSAVCFLCFERQDAVLFREDIASQRWIMTVIIPGWSCLFFLFLFVFNEVRKNEKPFSGMKV